MKKLITILFVLAFVIIHSGAVYASTAVFINEFHYDNAGVDQEEGIEIFGPAGTDLTGWSIELYNGSDARSYNTMNLSGTIPNLQNGYGTLWFAQSTIQNGAPDGMALIDNVVLVVQFLSYEGFFTAAGGPADELTSTDVGVLEDGLTLVGYSLQLQGAGFCYEDFSWVAPIASTYGAINTGQSAVPIPSAVWLLGSGLIGIVGVRRKFRK